MASAALLERTVSAPGPWGMAAVIVWSVLVPVCCLKPALSKPYGVYPTFADAGRRWAQGEDSYRVQGEAYRYSPTATAFFAVVGQSPDAVGGTAWRLLNAAVYLGGLAWFLRVALPWRLTHSQRALVFLLAVPLSIGSLHSGQSNALLMGLMLLGAAAFVKERWTIAAVGLALACLLKGYPVALALLFATLAPRRFGGRFVLLLALGLAVPFLMQRPVYVAGQYANWWECLRTQDRNDWPMEDSYRDVRMLIRAVGGSVSTTAYLLMQLASGAALCGLLQFARRAGWNRRGPVALAVSLGCCWMTLCGPATESSTYLLLAPVLGWSLLAVWRHPFERGLVLSSFGLFAFVQMLVWFPGTRAWFTVILHPLAGILLLAGLLTAIGRTLLQPIPGIVPRDEIGWQ